MEAQTRPEEAGFQNALPFRGALWPSLLPLWGLCFAPLTIDHASTWPPGGREAESTTAQGVRQTVRPLDLSQEATNPPLNCQSLSHCYC